MKKTIFCSNFGWTIESSSRSFDVHQFFPITNLHGIEQLKWSLNRLDDWEHINLHCHRTQMGRIIIKIDKSTPVFLLRSFVFWALEIYDHANAFATVIVFAWRRTKYLEDPKKKNTEVEAADEDWTMSVECQCTPIFRLSLLFWILIDARCALHSIIFRMPSTIRW